MTKNSNNFSLNSEDQADVAIIGGGPAGLAAAQWCSELGLDTVLIERASEFGGQLLNIYNPIRNYLGVEASNGREMRDRFVAALESRKFIRRLGANVCDIDTENRTVVLAGGERLFARTIILATGVRRRELGIEGEREFRGRGILESGSKDPAAVTGKKVLIVGGGDAALENALILSKYASRVIVVHRRQEFRARTEFLESVKQNPKIDLVTETAISRLAGTSRLTSAELRNLNSGRESSTDVDFALIRIGVEPNSELVKEKLELDNNRYIVTDSQCRTGTAGIFAAGDVANPISPAISTAIGSGTTAAKAVFDAATKRRPL